MKEQTYALSFDNEITICRIAGIDKGYGNEEGKVFHYDLVDGMVNVVVVKWKGYTYNPGSRYSMLKDYVPAETEVYEFSHVDEFGRRRFRLVTAFNSSGKKE